MRNLSDNQLQKLAEDLFHSSEPSGLESLTLGSLSGKSSFRGAHSLGHEFVKREYIALAERVLKYPKAANRAQVKVFRQQAIDAGYNVEAWDNELSPKWYSGLF